METDKVLALAREAGLAVTISSYDSLSKFAALLRREWVGLTEEEATELWERIDDRDSWELLVQVQAKLKEKNSGHI